MPAYYTVEYSFPYSTFTPNFVSEIYGIIFSCFPFQSGFWMSENDTPEEIIRWNTTLLAKKFKLGYDQHVEHDYKQVLLESDLYSHLRLFWMVQSSEMVLHLIVPEADVFLDRTLFKYDNSKVIPLLNLSVKIVNSFEVNTVQTYHELGEDVPFENVLNGEQPSTEPFSIAGSEAFRQFEKNVNDNFLVKKFNRGVIVLEKDYYSFVRDFSEPSIS